MEKRYWFTLRTKGFGWAPATWEGWLMVILWICMAVATARYSFMGALSNGSGFFGFLKLLLGWSVLFLIILWKKGEQPHFFQDKSQKESDEEKNKIEQ